ncbi:MULTISPECIES: sensory rhodopsin transducer [Cellulosimicrobium]|uniref:sensory rhodopsin transducer n=1 Tax=Cellulosimicrobium TaxID=157920 RepID=UPI001459F88A|nr:MULTISPECIES: sensory rhodopsin transducer [Cellulosimicrobium]MDQ8041417.1 sensory rhodopsin transducer [Cellulosimicrobium sp. XJ-DQ-B-000]NMF29424.1 sensory rhodopsin transducer [Cellulosimicrobium aquatile]
MSAPGAPARRPRVGATCWAIGDGWIPPYGTGDDPTLASHESLCLLNAGPDDARVEIRLYFADRPPAGPYVVVVPAERVRHVTLNDLDDPEPVPRGTDYSAVVVASAPVVVQHTRLDSRQAANALFSTIAHPVDTLREDLR